MRKLWSAATLSALVVLVTAAGPMTCASPSGTSSASGGSTLGWVQIGAGEFNTGSSAGTEPPHHQSGRMAQSAWAFDKHQGRDILWMGASHGGLWKSMVSSTGQILRWVPLTDNFPGSHTLGSFAIHPLDSDSILVGTGTTWGDGDGIYLTQDGGASWSANTLPLQPTHVWRIADDRSDGSGNTVVAASSFGIWRSDDFGLTWSRPLKGVETTDVLQDPNHSLNWYAGVKGSGVVYSNDGGSTYCPLGTGIAGSIRRVSLAASRADARYLYALVIDNDGSLTGIYRYDQLDQLPACDASDPAGSTIMWNDITANADNATVDALNQGGHTAGIAADPNDADHVIFGLQTPAESHNATAAAVTWDTTVDGGHHDYNHILFLPDDRTIVTANDGGYYLYDFVAHSLDDSGNLLGLNALEPSSGSKPGQGGFASSHSDPDVFVAGLQDNGNIVGNVSQDPAILRIGGGDGGQVSIMPDVSSFIAFSTTILAKGFPGHRFVSFDSGTNNFSVDCGLNGDSRSTMLIDPTPGVASPYVFTHSDDSQVDDSDDDKPDDPGAASSGVYYKPLFTFLTCDWQLVGPDRVPGTITQLDHTTNPSLHEIVLTLKDDHRLFAYSDVRGHLGALPLFERTPPLCGTPAPPTCDPPANADARTNADRSTLQPDTVYYTSGRARPSSAFMSFDGGVTWTDVRGDIDQDVDLYRLVANPKDTSQLYLATSDGVFRSLDGGAHWTDYSRGLRIHEIVEDMVINSDQVDPPTLYVATEGRGFWRRTLVNHPPTVTCAAPTTAECTGSGTQVTIAAHVDDEDGDELSVVWEVDGVTEQTTTVPTQGSPADVTFAHAYAKGAHTVKVTVSDGQDAASCTTVVTIVDTTPPAVTCSVGTSALWPPNHDLVGVGLQATAIDVCDGPLPVAVAVSSDEDDRASGGGESFSPDAKDVAPGTLRLRSERSGDADGRVYLIAATADDASGNEGHACCAVVVPHDQSAASRAGADAQAAAAKAICPALPSGYSIVGDGPVVGPKQ